MGNPDDFAWPPLESEIDGLEIVDVETGAARAVRGVDPAPLIEREPTTVVRVPAARHIPHDFTWPPAEDPRDVIVPLGATLDGGSPWAPVADRDSIGDAETLVAHARRRPHPGREWLRWAAALLLFAAGGALLERQVRDGLRHLADRELARATTVESRAAGGGDAGRVAPVARDAMFADVRLPRGFGDVGIGRPLPVAERPPVVMPTAAVVARRAAPPQQTPPGVSPAAWAPPPTLVGSATSLAPPALAFGAAPRVSMAAAPAIEARPPADEARIEATLTRYRTAYASLDAAAARSVWPSVDARALERAFGSLKSQGLDFDGCKTDVKGPEATSTCRGRTTYVPRIGNQRPRTEEHQWRFKLRKVDESWLIVTADAS
jgi:hypothetical protein